MARRKRNPELKDVRVVGSNMVEAHHGSLHILYSYKTPVAILAPSGLYKTDHFHSRTTSGHIGKWFRAWNLDPKGAMALPQDVIERYAENGVDPVSQRGTPKKNAPRRTARTLSVPERHQLKIARDSLKMPDAMLGVMGGPSKAEARVIVKRLTGKTPRENTPRNPWSSRTKRYVLVYQAGIANVFKVKSFNLSDYGRDAQRLLQGDFRSCEQFARGLAAAGGVVRTAACNRAGDIIHETWTEDLDSQPFSEKFQPVRENPGTRRKGRKVVRVHAGKNVRVLRRRRNPAIGILGNPPASHDGKYLGKVTYIEYTHGHDGEKYFHEFSPAVFAQVTDDGGVRLWHPTNKLWKLFPETR